MTDRRDTHPGMHDRSLFHVLSSLLAQSAVQTEAIKALGDKEDGVEARIEAVETGHAQCRAICGRFATRLDGQNDMLTKAWASKPVQWALGALLLIAVTMIARCANVPIPLLSPGPATPPALNLF